MTIRRAAFAAAQGGTALVYSLIAVIMISGAVVGGTAFLLQSTSASKSLFESRDQAYGVARAGLIDGLSWFRRQTTQPVTAFTPRRDLVVVPPINETDNPAVGIVRNYAITPGIWARYEVRLAGQPEGVLDVTAARGLPGSGPGTIWQIISHGYVFRRNFIDTAAPGNPWNEALEWDNARHIPAPSGVNLLLAQRIVSTEVRRLTIVPPAAASLCVQRGSNCTIANRCRVSGVSVAGLVYKSATGAPTVGGTLSGTPAQAGFGVYLDDWQDVFGMPLQDLLAMPDVKVTTVANLPAELPLYSMTYVQGNATFDAARPLRSSAAVLIVDGDCTVNDGSNSFFSGFLYVRGNMVLRAPSSLRGTVAVRGTFNGSGLGDYSELWGDDKLLNVLMQKMGQYRISQAIRVQGIQGTNVP